MPKRKRPKLANGDSSRDQKSLGESHDPRAMPRAFWETAIGKPIDSPEVIAVIRQLGNKYEVQEIKPNISRFDPDLEGAFRWEFPNVPKANYYATHLRVRNGFCASIVLTPLLVADARIPRNQYGIVIGSNAPDIMEYLPYGPEWNWAPQIIRRGDQHLFNLDVPQGHWDGNYKFRITPNQARVLQADPVVYRKLWDALVKIAQSRRFFDDPATLPVDAQVKIDSLLGSD